jgi:hypothetical protein
MFLLAANVLNFGWRIPSRTRLRAREEIDLSFEEILGELSRFPCRRLSFALVRLELAVQLGHEPTLHELWAAFEGRHPEARRNARTLVALGLLAPVEPKGKPLDQAAAPACEAPLDLMEPVPCWWRHLERQLG